MAQIKETLKVGKSGITENIIKELIDQLQKRKKVTVKFLGTIAEDQKSFVQLAQKLAESTNSEIIHKVGHTATYLKK